MKIIKQSVELLYASDISLMETAGRNCYQSKSAGKPGEFIKKIIKMGHLGVLEHSMIMFKIITDRAVSHQLVRHRMASYCQESQRYCRYGKNVLFIDQGFDDKIRPCWIRACEDSEFWYLRMLKAGAKPEDARSVLNNSVATKIIMTANLREYLWVIKQRISPKAQRGIREIVGAIKDTLVHLYPIEEAI